MGFSTVRDEIKTLLLAVSGIGQVHDFRRHSTTWGEIYQRTVKDGKLNNWEITRSSAFQEIDNVQNAAGTEPFFQDTHNVVVLGHMALNDSVETEKTFQDLVDNIVAKIRVTNTLNNKVLLPRQLQVPVIEHQMFGGTLVHFAEMNFEAIERVGG